MNTYLAIFGKPRYLGLVKIEEVCKSGTWVVLKTMRGLELGLLGGVLSPEQEEKYRNVGNDDGEPSHGAEPMLQEVAFVAVAGEGDMKVSKSNRVDEDRGLLKSRELLVGHKLAIKLVEVEYLFDRKKLFFYFTADHRVDFRAYVRDLAREFRTRIEMRQIGVRDEARSAKGLAQCGQPCCCSYWLHKFTPICIRMVKEQNLALNPTKISGLCGRLMCCMAFEHEMYGELWKGLPGPGSKLKGADGNYIIDGIDIKNEALLVRFPHGGDIPIAITEFEKFKQTITSGGEWELTEEQRSRIPTARVRATRDEEESKDSRENDRFRARRTPQKQEKISIEEHIAARSDAVRPDATRPEPVRPAPAQKPNPPTGQKPHPPSPPPHKWARGEQRRSSYRPKGDA